MVGIISRIIRLSYGFVRYARVVKPKFGNVLADAFLPAALVLH